jgi:hypothetical protein
MKHVVFTSNGMAQYQTHLSDLAKNLTMKWSKCSQINSVEKLRTFNATRRVTVSTE